MNINKGEFKSDLYCKSTHYDQFLDFNSAHPIYNKNWLFLARSYILKDCVQNHKHLRNILKVYILNLTSFVVPRNTFAIKVRGFSKANPSRLPHIKTAVGVRVVTYHPRFHDLNNVIRKHFIYWYIEE